MSWHNFYVSRGVRFLNAVPGAAAATVSHLKYSDWLQLLSILAGAIATGSAFHFLVEYNPDIVGTFAGVATLAGISSAFLQSKGD